MRSGGNFQVGGEREAQHRGTWVSLLSNPRYLRDAFNVGVWDPQLASSALSQKSPDLAVEAVRAYKFLDSNLPQTNQWRLNTVFN